VPLEKIDGGIVYPRYDGGEDHSVLSGSGHVVSVGGLVVLRAAVRTADAYLTYGDRTALSHARCFNIRGRGDEYFGAVLANEAVEGCEPLFVVGEESQRKVLGGVRFGRGLENAVRHVSGRIEGRELIDEGVELISAVGRFAEFDSLREGIEALVGGGWKGWHAELSAHIVSHPARLAAVLLLELLVELGLLLLELMLQVDIVLLQLKVLLELNGVDARRSGTHRAGGFMFGEALTRGEELLAVSAGGPVALVVLEVGANSGKVIVCRGIRRQLL